MFSQGELARKREVAVSLEENSLFLGEQRCFTVTEKVHFLESPDPWWWERLKSSETALFP